MAAGAQKRRRILIAAIAGVVAIGAFALVFTQLSTARTTPPPAAAAVSTATAKAVVAIADINVGDQLTAANIAVADYPAAALPAAGLFYTDTKDLVASAWYSTVKLPRGQPLLTTSVTQEVTPQKLPPVPIANNNVAMAVPYDPTTGAAGFVQQDDYVDILVDDTSTNTIHYAFQGVHVVRVGTRDAQPVAAAPAAGTAPAAAGASPAPASGTLLLIELPRQQAAALAFAIDNKYTIRYLIRPHSQQSQTTLPNSAPVGASNWLSILNG